MLVDTHCHIHESSYPLDAEDAVRRARAAGVGKMICVGTSQQSSREAVAFAAAHEDIFASVGVHPHDTKDGWEVIRIIIESMFDSRTVSSQNGFAPGLTGAPAPGQSRAADVLTQKGSSTRSGELVAVGEIGLDYFYTHSPRDMQIRALEAQLDLALKYNLPIIFHVREAFDDFWPIFDNFHGIRGELHSFTDTKMNLEEGLKRGLSVGVNGISTFTKDKAQQEMYASIPLVHMLLETDAPFLTPAPLRGKVNEPAFVRNIAEYHANLRDISLEEISAITTANATALFAL
jgi:TatD DNase family protein